MRLPEKIRGEKSRERRAGWFFIACFAAVLPATLMAFPTYATPNDELQQTRQELEQTEETQARLAEEAAEVEAELASLQDKLVPLASTIQKAESELTDAEEKLRILNDQLQEKNKELAARKKYLASLIQAALSLSHTPPEAMVMMPGDVTQTIKAARTLKLTSESIRQETQSIGLQLAELNVLKDKVARNRDVIARKQATLDNERKGLVRQMAERKALQEKLGLEQKKNSAKLASLAKKARDLQDLVSAVEKELSEQEEPAVAEEKTEAKPATPADKRSSLRSFADAKGRLKPPVSGQMVQKFGAAQGRSTSKGISVNARRGAQVTALYDGEVVFTGPFLAYGKMVILRHSDHYHSLLAGLSKIDVAVGQFLLEGEPIGAMGDSKSGNKLYIELRKNNQPVDPAPWISGFNKNK
jgi:murein hydrolase activator